MRSTNLFSALTLLMVLAAATQITDFSATYVDNLSGWSMGTSHCGSIGQLVGGYNVAGHGAVIRKTFTLPSSTCSARIQLDFVKIDSWDNEMGYVKINDVVKWTGGPWQYTHGPSHVCGASSNGNYREAVHSVDITTTEKTQLLKIEVYTSLNEHPNNESFGIKNIRITPECYEPCGENVVTPIADNACQCGTDLSNVCDIGNFCYDNGCESSAKHDDCEVSQYDITNRICGCQATQVCSIGQYCYDAACHSDAQCHRPEKHDPFYGAKLTATWHPSQTTMELSIPLSSYLTLDKITWVNADVNADPSLGYTQTDAGLWTKTPVDNKPCINDYTLSANQNTFFGAGSSFHLTGSQMRTLIKVEALEKVIITRNHHTYKKDRKIRNSLPLTVNLVTRPTIKCDFVVTYATTLARDAHAGPCYAVILQLTPGTVDDDVLLAECQTTYGNKHNVECESVEDSSNGLTQINFNGEQDDLDAITKEINDNGWSTSSTDLIDATAYCPALEPEEFIIFLDAFDDIGDDSMQTITLELEVHSRGCIDHDNNDVRVVADSQQYIKDGSSTFTWTLDDNGDIAFDIQDNLCVETVTWTFRPADYTGDAYNVNIDLEFDLQENLLNQDLPSFIATATIDIKEETDVLGEVGFETAIALYDNAACLADHQSTVFNLGQKFWAKIVLSNLVVQTSEITCTGMRVVQTDEFNQDVVTNMMEPEYNFVQIAKSVHGLDNTVICGAELESPHFFISLDGWESELQIDLSIAYVEGDVQNLRLRRKLMGNNYDFKELSLGDEDEFYANKKREPEQKSISMEFTILAETEVGSFGYTIIKNRGSAGLVLLSGIVMAGVLVYMKNLGNKNAENWFLLEEEF